MSVPAPTCGPMAPAAPAPSTGPATCASGTTRAPRRRARPRGAPWGGGGLLPARNDDGAQADAKVVGGACLVQTGRPAVRLRRDPAPRHRLVRRHEPAGGLRLLRPG